MFSNSIGAEYHLPRRQDVDPPPHLAELEQRKAAPSAGQREINYYTAVSNRDIRVPLAPAICRPAAILGLCYALAGACCRGGPGNRVPTLDVPLDSAVVGRNTLTAELQGTPENDLMLIVYATGRTSISSPLN